MKPRHYLMLFLLTVVLASCCRVEPALQIEHAGRANPWTHLNLNNNPINFQFVIVSDRTGGVRPGVFADAVRKTNLLEPEFVICIGDLIEGHTEEPAKLEHQWNQFEALVDRLDMPFFYVPGNHDIDNELSLQEWKKRFGRPYYHFIYHDVLFLCLDSEGGFTEHKEDHIGDEQIKYFQNVLRKYPKVRWTLVFLHKPLWEDDNPSWLKFEGLLANRKYTVFAGHKHQYAFRIRNGRRYIRLATTGAASPLKGPAVGTFDHIVWVTMTDEGPKLANLMLNGIYDENVTPYPVAAMARKLKDKIDKGEVLKFEPILVKDGVFIGGKTRLTITNFAALPMKITGSFNEISPATVTPNSIETTVLPLLSKTFDIEVAVDKPTRPEDLQPITFVAEIAYQFAGKGPIKTTVRSSVAIRRQEKQ